MTVNTKCIWETRAAVPVRQKNPVHTLLLVTKASEGQGIGKAN